MLALACVAAGAAGRPADASMFDSAIETISSGFDYLWPDELELKDFSLRLGAGAGVMPDYEGSNNYTWRIVPLIDLRYKNLLVLQGSKLRFNLLRHKYVHAGPLLRLRFGRKESDNPILEGLGKVGDAWQIGAFVESQYKGLLVSAELRQALGNRQGTSVRGIIAHGLYKDDKTLIILGARGEWNSAKANLTNFGITGEQSLSSGLPEFAPGAGVASLGVHLIGRYQINEKWRLEAIAGYARMLDGAADSPLVATYGSANQVVAGAGFRYSF